MHEPLHLAARLNIPSPEQRPLAGSGLEPLGARCARDVWNKASLPQFVDHCVATHHPHLEKRLRRAEKAIVMLAARRGLAQGHALEIAKVFVELADRVRANMADENRWFARLLQGADLDTDKLRESAVTRGVEALVARRLDQDAIAAMFEQIRSLASDDDVADDCLTYRTMVNELAALEEDYFLHRSEVDDQVDAALAG
ncbi:MAG: hypothetical protein KDA41_18825 [Planctomycetales bacterium]|nr:hypothetical protein [Planctomycetales bacterium]